MPTRPMTGSMAIAKMGATLARRSEKNAARNRDGMALSPLRIGGAKVPCRFYRWVTPGPELVLKFDKTSRRCARRSEQVGAEELRAVEQRIRARRRVGKHEIARIAEK